MGIKFKDVGKKWKPTSISIVDKPGHPLAVFEVYEDDDEIKIMPFGIEITYSDDNVGVPIGWHTS